MPGAKVPQPVRRKQILTAAYRVAAERGLTGTRIGEVATRARAFGMTLTGYDPYVSDERFDGLRVHRCATLVELLDGCDVLTVHTPLTDETTGMIGRPELARLKRGAIVANLARGGIVDETALIEALSSGYLGGATIDAFANEPREAA